MCLAIQPPLFSDHDLLHIPCGQNSSELIFESEPIVATRTLFLIVVLCGLFLFPSQAEAGRGLVLWGQSQDISLVKSLDDVPDSDLGYMYSYFSLFFVNVWTWGGQFVLYKDDSYSDLPTQDAGEIATLLGIESGEVKKPIGYTIPLGAVILGVILLLVLVMKLKGSSDEEEIIEESVEETDA